MEDPILRFSRRVGDYRKYRPSYPSEIIELLTQECGLTSRSVVADVGSGTGLLSELFLKNGNRVFGIEPNAEMRLAGKDYLKAYPQFSSVEGTAEATTLSPASVDLVTAGQAFHWFDPVRSRAELSRILAPAGWAVLIWNIRHPDSTAFLAAYERLLSTYGTDYKAVTGKQTDLGRIRLFLGDGFKSKSFRNTQSFDFIGLKGRLLSSSYTPEIGEPGYGDMLDQLRDIFSKHHERGRVRFEYTTDVYYGQLEA